MSEEAESVEDSWGPGKCGSELGLLKLSPEEMKELSFDEELPIIHSNTTIIGTFNLTLRPVGNELMVHVESSHRRSGLAYKLELTGWVDQDLNTCEEYREEWATPVTDADKTTRGEPPEEEEKVGGRQEDEEMEQAAPIEPTDQEEIETLDQALSEGGEQEGLWDENEEMHFEIEDEGKEEEYSSTDDVPGESKGVQEQSLDSEDKDESPKEDREESDPQPKKLQDKPIGKEGKRLGEPKGGYENSEVEDLGEENLTSVEEGPADSSDEERGGTPLDEGAEEEFGQRAISRTSSLERFYGWWGGEDFSRPSLRMSALTEPSLEGEELSREEWTHWDKLDRDHQEEINKIEEEERRRERVRRREKWMERRLEETEESPGLGRTLFLEKSGDEYKAMPGGKEDIPFTQQQSAGLLSESAILLLMRKLVLVDYQGRFEVSSVLINGQIAVSHFHARHIRSISVGEGEGVGAKRVERRVVWRRAKMDWEETEPQAQEELITCWFNAKGRLLRVSWASEPAIILGLPHLKLEESDGVTSPDFRLVSRFLHELDLAHLELTSYLDQHPEFLQFLSYFLRDLLFNKPQDVLKHAQSFVSKIF